jgi:ABC-type Fe3+-citrate transport system substrate-binding protein
MNKKVFLLSAILLSSTLLTACSTLTLSEKSVENTIATDTNTIVMNNYPTRDRVEYVFNCIAKHGGKNKRTA